MKNDLIPSAADKTRHRNVRRAFLPRASTAVGTHALLVLEGRLERKDTFLGDLRAIAREHYVAPTITAKRLASLGAPRTAAILAVHLPTSKTSRSGDAGEILATEVAESSLGYRVPIRRLRWKDGREMALRGDDLIGLARAEDASLQFLKGEAKSRASLKQDAIDDAAESLDRDRGRPSRHSVLFIADRLREQGSDSLAEELEDAVLQSFRNYEVAHLLFALTGTDPLEMLRGHLESCRRRRKRHAVGLHIKGHAAFITALYESK